MDIADILLRVTGDADDARQELRHTAADLAAFDRERAEAELEITSGQARAELKEVRKELGAIDRTKVSAEVEAVIAEAMLQLQIVERQIKHLDGMDADVDIDVRRGAVESIVGSLNHVRGALQAVVPDFGNLTKAADEGAGALQSVGLNLGAISLRLGTLGPVVFVVAGLMTILAAAVTAVAIALIAMAASLTAAFIGLGAIALAMGGALAVIGAFGLAVANALKGKGPLATAVKDAVTDLGKAFKTATSDGVKAFLRGLAPAIQSVIPLVKSLKPAFTAFGEAAGKAVQYLGARLGELGPQFRQLINGAAELAGPIADGLAGLLEVLLNIANSAMPFLVSGAQAVADKLNEWAEATGDAEAMRSAIGGLVDHLSSWWDLLTAVFDIFKELFQVIAGQGKGVVDTLAQGAQALADWIANNPDVIRQFFDDVLPLAGSFLKAVLQLVLAFVQFVQTVAPALTMVFDAFTLLLEVINLVVAALKPFLQLGARILTFLVSPIATIIGLFIQFGAVATAVWDAIKAAAMGAALFIAGVVPGLVAAGAAVIGAIWGALAATATAIWGVITSVVQAAALAAVSAAVGIWNAGKAAVTAVWNAIKTAATTVWNAIKAVINAIVNAMRATVVAVWNAAAATVKGIWNGLKTAATTAWNAIKTAVQTATNAARSLVGSVWRTAAATVKGIWNGIKTAASTIWDGIKTVVSEALDGALAIIEGLVGSFFNAGKALIQGLVDGIKSMAGAVKGAVGDVAGSARDMLPFSEPKDPRSPLRGLAESGRAIVENLVAGVTGSGSLLSNALGSELAGAQFAVSAAARDLAPAAATGRDINITAPMTVTGRGGQPDATELQAKLSALLRSWGGFR